MKDKTCRIMKIDKDAIFEFIYENFIAQEEDLLDIKSKVGISNHFDINWDTGEFIFLAHNDEDADGNLISLPKGIDIKKTMDYTFDELSQLMKG